MPLSALLARDADPHYVIEDGRYRFTRYGETSATNPGHTTVAIAYSARCAIPTAKDDIDDLVLHKHGTPENVHNWVRDTRRKLSSQGGEVGRRMASELFMIEGPFDIQLLNGAIQGKKGALLSIIEQANTLTADGLAIDHETLTNHREAVPLAKAQPMSKPTHISVADGKYTVVIDGGKLSALRNGETWRDLTGDKFVYCLAYELDEARQEIARLKAAGPSKTNAATTDATDTLSSGAQAKPLLARPQDQQALRPVDAQMMVTLMNEAAKNLRDLMSTPQADALQVRHFLPDELEGAALMLLDAQGLAATKRIESEAQTITSDPAPSNPPAAEANAISLIARVRSRHRHKVA